MQKEKSFQQHRGERLNGFKLVFPNGNSASTIWSQGTYSDNYDFEILGVDGKLDISKMNTPLSSDTVEVMVDCPEITLDLLHEKFNTENGSVFGHLSMEQYLIKKNK